jgi:hypothetical protein
VFQFRLDSVTTVVGTPLHVLDFAANVTVPKPLALNFVGADSLVTLPAAAGHNYQLQPASTLSPPDWTNASPVTTGVAGLLVLPDVNGRGANQRFYRVVAEP